MNVSSIFGMSKRWTNNLVRGMWAFGVAGVGFAVTMIAGWLSIQWLGVVGFIICAAGVLGGFVVVAMGFFMLPGEIAEKVESFRESRNQDENRGQ